MTDKDFYKLFREENAKANAFAREVVQEAKGRRVRIPMLMKALCEEHAACEADIASDGAYQGGYDRGISDGRAAERQGWWHGRPQPTGRAGEIVV